MTQKLFHYLRAEILLGLSLALIVFMLTNDFVQQWYSWWMNR